MSVKEQLQQQAGADLASQSGGPHDGSVGEDDEEDEVVAVDDGSSVNLSQFGKAFKVCGVRQSAECIHQLIVANGMDCRRRDRECYTGTLYRKSTRCPNACLFIHMSLH